MSDLILYLRRNRMEVVNLKDNNVAQGEGAFTTTRLLVGHFKVAEELLTKLMGEVKSRGFFIPQPRLLVQPLEMIEGGLCEIEERVFSELGASAGARHVKLYVGPKLSAQAALDVLNARG